MTAIDHATGTESAGGSHADTRTDDTGTQVDSAGAGGEDLAPELAVAVIRLARELRGHYQHTSPLTLTQLSVLNALASDGPLQPGQLAARERMKPSSLTRIVRSVEELGLISRESNPRDARVVILALTDAGRAAIDNDRDARDRWLTDKLTALTDYERDTLTAATHLLDRMQHEN